MPLFQEAVKRQLSPRSLYLFTGTQSNQLLIVLKLRVVATTLSFFSMKLLLAFRSRYMQQDAVYRRAQQGEI